ncbi:MAG: TetR family transcriptional regulator [Symbiobacteriaceae bacterium]|jgi:AcrR family transcriptional regulator|nr:TetR family transcriptional regulator [Symbiobacteriaceae bacterium]
MPRVSAEHKEQRRQAILDAAMEVFIGKGYQLATINDISAHCNLSVGALYRYFPTKGEIMLTLVEERLGRTPATFARLTEKAGTPWERLVSCVNLFTSALGVRHPSTGRLLLVTLTEAVHDSEVRRGLHGRFKALREYLSTIIADGIAAGMFRPDADADTLATLLLCTADGGTVYWVTGTPNLDLRTLRSMMLALLRSYLMPDASDEHH